ncbi:unnamed protein product [Rotaria socialis]|uniref:Phospholipase B1, membrane-associated n=2 Tax=Rotaria socialis TaxID=392032 RepID=A0A817QKA9_9BILA|nr:unnamed protein product [Rotaria socialis]CAF3324999.1 unnamed protein product [Rotaria socialis]CAF3509146.1 unnamed protein product [Rotaria socialis]CAF3538076.1 unnamed protein product [Rotaria socialis]CAF4235203.1 unnamed protein product [Rotaria socialis]
MMKFIIFTVVCFQLFLGKSFGFDADSYARFIDELSVDEKFLEEYAKWSLELFSQPDYLYGKPRGNFPCEITKDTNVPTSVHALRPSDIKCVGAIGDSLTAGLGAHAATPIGLTVENRGLSWSVGGDHTYSKVLSVPNALRQYNPDLKGFSTKFSVIFLNGQNATNNGLNVAKSGDRSNHMPDQAGILMSRIKDEKLCDWNNDWKIITFFVGGNDLCSFCEDKNVSKHTPEQYVSYVRDTLDKLYNAAIPRTLVNLVLVLDVRSVQSLNSGGFVCETLHKRTCPCAAFPTPEEAKTLDDYVPQYHQLLLDLAASTRYDGREDFTVVVQPFMAKTKIPVKDDNKIDFSYFAPDCFHFSGKGHAQAALSLWNNMFEPVGGKQWFWHINEELKCPTKEYPFIFTKKNSAKALEEYQRATHAPSMSTSTSKPAKHTTKHHKHHKSHSDSSFSKMQLVVLASLFLLILILFALVITKRQQIRGFAHGAGRRHLNGFTNPQYPDDNDNDEVEIWSRSNVKSGFTNKNDIPKTHGSRISFA